MPSPPNWQSGFCEAEFIEKKKNAGILPLRADVPPDHALFQSCRKDVWHSGRAVRVPCGSTPLQVRPYVPLLGKLNDSRTPLI